MVKAQLNDLLSRA